MGDKKFVIHRAAWIDQYLQPSVAVDTPRYWTPDPDRGLMLLQVRREPTRRDGSSK